MFVQSKKCRPNGAGWSTAMRGNEHSRSPYSCLSFTTPLSVLHFFTILCDTIICSLYPATRLHFIGGELSIEIMGFFSLLTISSTLVNEVIARLEAFVIWLSHLIDGADAGMLALGWFHFS